MISAKEAISLMESNKDFRIMEMLDKIEEGIKKATRNGLNAYFWSMKPQDNDIDAIKDILTEAGFSIHETFDGDGDVELIISWAETDRLKKKLEIDQLKYKKRLENPSSGISIGALMGR